MNSIRIFRLIAATVTIAFLSTLYLFHTGRVDLSLAPPTIILLLSFSLISYLGLYHDFSRGNSVRRTVAIGVVSVILIASLIWIAVSVLFGGIAAVFEIGNGGVILPPEEFLPDWWLLVLLVPAGIFLVSGAVLDTERPSYSAPNGLHELAESPIYFALTCTVIGLWSVLFVGLNVVQRIVIIAPIFEELLKFGVALTVGAAIFGKSIYSRIAIALVIGCIFGLVEHSITYAGEPDTLYLYRVLFHSVLTMISVTVYTRFEERDLNNLLWIAPIYPIVLHYLNNAFAVLSGVVLATTPEETQLVVSLVFGGLILLLGVALLIIVITRHNLAALLHREPYLFLRGVM